MTTQHDAGLFSDTSTLNPRPSSSPQPGPASAVPSPQFTNEDENPAERRTPADPSSKQMTFADKS